MPICKDREYRELLQPLSVATIDEKKKLLSSNFYVEGYATTFEQPYVLWEDADGTKIYEVIDRHALDHADISDVILQYDHEGHVFARQSNSSLVIQPNDSGLLIGADLSRTDGAKKLYEEIAAGMITKMSWAFTVKKDSYDRETHTRKILEVKKVYDVSAVSIPANPDTEIMARNFVQGRLAAEQQEVLEKRAAILKLKTIL